jgi:hypothetical protein
MMKIANYRNEGSVLGIGGIIFKKYRRKRIEREISFISKEEEKK